MKDLLMIVPTRSRPQNVARVVAAWHDTYAFEAADLMFVVDADDQALDVYLDEVQQAARLGGPIIAQVAPRWEPLVPKLSRSTMLDRTTHPARFAYGFAGDDHLPRTPGWVEVYLDALREMRTGVVYPDDGYQHENLPTSWAMTADVVDLLGGQIPLPVEHLYCDNALRDLGRLAGCLRYLPEVLVEHMSPYAGKAETDEQYARVNGGRQYRRDRRVYREGQAAGLPRQAAELRAIVGRG